MKAPQDFRDRHAARAEHVLYAPFFSGYFEALGVPSENIVYSDYTSGRAVPRGRQPRRDRPVLPVQDGHRARPQPALRQAPEEAARTHLLPDVDVLHYELVNLQGSNACPTVTARPETVKAAFTKEGDVFAEKGITYPEPVPELRRPHAVRAADVRGVQRTCSGFRTRRTIAPSRSASRQLEQCESEIQRRAREVLDQLEREDRLGIVLLARVVPPRPGPEPRDPGGVPEARVPDLFTEHAADRRGPAGAAVRRRSASRRDQHPLEIDDVWKNSYSASTNTKVWAAKFTARASEPGGARDVELQVRPRRADLQRHRGHRREERARRTSASRTSTRTSRPVRSGSASRPSTTSCGAIAKTS